MADDPQDSFDLSNRLPESARDGMQRADEHADPDWKLAFDYCVVEAARKKQEITSDDVLAEWEAIPDRPDTHNLSAIGPAMKRAAKDGVLSSTNRVICSGRAVKHGIRHTIWHSNIYQGAA
jgi:hypothetical protein